MSDDEPGQCDGGLPVAKHALKQKRNVRDLNTRLEMYVRAQSDKARTINSLKDVIARNEMDARTKLKQKDIAYRDTLEKLRKENENYAYENKCIQQELSSINAQCKDNEDRLTASESKNAAIMSERENLQNDVARIKQELDVSRKQYASIKYKFDSYELERNQFEERMTKLKIKYEQTLRELTQKEAVLKQEKETYDRVLIAKNDELDKYRIDFKNLQFENDSTQSRLRKEFDNKLAEFVQKREEQYKQEKDEWMRIFKEEFNRKLRSFKEANQELAHSNVKQQEDITDLRTRISKLKQQKTELEVQNRNNEEEAEKLRNDLDDLRRSKDAELKVKNALLLQERDRYKAKELQFDELAGIKLQLDSEIELYRNILNEAEQECGYDSPLKNSNQNQTNDSNTNGKFSRKRKRLNNGSYETMTPIGPMKSTSKLCVDEENDSSKKVVTPGIERAAKLALNDLRAFAESDEDDADMKEREEDDDASSISVAMAGNRITPGIEGSALQFSGLDLNRGMIEIQNMGENDLQLSGYSLSNKEGSMQFDMPKTMSLSPKATLRIYVGEELYKQLVGCGDEEEEDGTLRRDKIIGNYEGAFVCWGRDVWTGNHDDCARLYNPTQEEVARIEISPDMVDKSASKHGCLMM